MLPNFASFSIKGVRKADKASKHEAWHKQRYFYFSASEGILALLLTDLKKTVSVSSLYMYKEDIYASAQLATHTKTGAKSIHLRNESTSDFVLLLFPLSRIEFFLYWQNGMEQNGIQQKGTEQNTIQYNTVQCNSYSWKGHTESTKYNCQIDLGLTRK